MEFEFDPAKSRSNLEKHGICFEEAQRLWLDPQRLEVAAQTSDELRLALIAAYKGKVWTAIFTIRQSRTRIISVRRAKYGEEKRYHQR